MGKKYAPSGYQIIRLDLIENDGKLIVADSDDKKLLIEIRKESVIDNNQEPLKPVLLDINDTVNSYRVTGFGIWLNNSGLSIWTNGSVYNFEITIDNVSVTFTE